MIGHDMYADLNGRIVGAQIRKANKDLAFSDHNLRSQWRGRTQNCRQYHPDVPEHNGSSVLKDVALLLDFKHDNFAAVDGGDGRGPKSRSRCGYRSAFVGWRRSMNLAAVWRIRS